MLIHHSVHQLKQIKMETIMKVVTKLIAIIVDKTETD